MQYSSRKSNDVKYIRVGYSLKLIGIGNRIDFPSEKKTEKRRLFSQCFTFIK